MKRHSFVRLVKSDFNRLGYKFNLFHFFKSLINPSFQAAFLIRVVQCSRGFFYPFSRLLLILMYKIDVGYRAKIGFGILIPHPLSIVIGAGVVIGSNSTLYQGVTIGSKNQHYPIISKNVTIYSNSVVIGKIRIRKNCIIGACKFLDKSLLKPGTIYR